MEPVAALATIIGVGLKLGKAWNEDGVGAAELAAIKELLEGADQLKASGDATTDAEAMHLALITAAFGAALRQHWAGWERYVPRKKWWQNRDARERRRELETRMGLVTDALQALGQGADREQLTHVDALTGQPMATPFYKALWDAFTTRENIRLDSRSFELFIRDDTPSEIRAFQDRFLLAYWQGLTTGPGRQVAAYLGDLPRYRQRSGTQYPQAGAAVQASAGRADEQAPNCGVDSSVGAHHAAIVGAVSHHRAPAA